MPFDATPQVETFTDTQGPVEATLRKARALFPHKATWWQAGRTSGQRCPLIAIGQVGETVEARCGAVRMLTKAIGGGLVHVWNDAAERTFPEIQEAFDRAIALAAEEHE